MSTTLNYRFHKYTNILRMGWNAIATKSYWTSQRKSSCQNKSLEEVNDLVDVHLWRWFLMLRLVKIYKILFILAWKAIFPFLFLVPWFQSTVFSANNMEMDCVTELENNGMPFEFAFLKVPLLKLLKWDVASQMQLKFRFFLYI